MGGRSRNPIQKKSEPLPSLLQKNCSGPSILSSTRFLIITIMKIMAILLVDSLSSSATADILLILNLKVGFLYVCTHAADCCGHKHHKRKHTLGSATSAVRLRTMTKRLVPPTRAAPQRKLHYDSCHSQIDLKSNQPAVSVNSISVCLQDFAPWRPSVISPLSSLITGIWGHGAPLLLNSESRGLQIRKNNSIFKRKVSFKQVT